MQRSARLLIQIPFPGIPLLGGDLGVGLKKIESTFGTWNLIAERNNGRESPPRRGFRVGLKCLGPLWNSVECFKFRKARFPGVPL